MFRKSPNSKTCFKPECNNTLLVLLHGAERIFPARNPENKSSGSELAVAKNIPAIRTQSKRNAQNSTCAISILSVNGLIPIIILSPSSSTYETNALVLWDSA